MATVYVIGGPPGSGKDHISEILTNVVPEVTFVSTGKLKRLEEELNTPLAFEANRDKDDRKVTLWADHFITPLVKKFLVENLNKASKFLLNGFPRTIGQAQELVNILGQDGHEIVLIRLETRSELCQARIVQRSAEGRADDQDMEEVQKRIRDYREITVPALEWIGNVPGVKVFYFTNDQDTTNKKITDFLKEVVV